MPDLTMILLGIIAIAILWMVMKFFLKLTMKIFSCGCLLIFIIGAALYFTGYLQITASF